MFENIVWSEQSCSLNTVIERYPLPQLVKVEEGIYGAEEAETLSKDDILTLHFTKRTDKLLVEDADHKQYFVPLNCPCTVEILPIICEDRYYSVEDVVDAWTSADFKFIRVVHNGPPQLRIRAGDILKLRKTVEEKRVKFLECEFDDKTKDLVRLPLDFKAAFEPLACAEQYHLQEVGLKKLPVRAKFTSFGTTIQGAHNINVDLPSLGSVLLKEFREERTVIATSRNDHLVTVLMIPQGLDVNVFPALGAVIGDKEYARFCKGIHDGTELAKVDFSKNDSIMCEEPTVDVIYDYAEVKPLLPSRKHRDSNQSDDSDSSDDYQDVEGPPIPTRTTSMGHEPMTQSEVCVDVERPPRPPKPPPKPKPKPKPLVSGPQYENMQTDSELKAPTEKPLDFYQASPRDFDDRNDDNVDDDDENPYLSSDDSEDYIYPDSDEPEPNTSSDCKPEAPKENLGLSEKSSIKNRFIAKLTKLTKAAGSPQRPCPTPSSLPNIPSTLSTSPWAAAGQDTLQSFPDDLGNLSVSKVGECLRMLNMGEHVETFESEQIDGQLFITLDEVTLPCLGVSNKLQQQKLLKFIQGWRPNTN